MSNTRSFYGTALSRLQKLFSTSRPRVVVVTAYDSSFDQTAKITVPRMSRYAERHGYPFYLDPESRCGRPGGWIKIPVIRRLLSAEFDYIFWLDADALIVREDVDVAGVIDSRADLQMSWLGPETTDWQAPPSLVGHFNTGVMLIRVSEWSREFFARVWKIGDLGLSWKDQAAVLHVLGYDNLIGLGEENPGSPYRSRVIHLDPMWNSVPGVAMAPDPVIHHYDGMDHATRLSFVQSDIDFVRNADEFARRHWARELSARVKQARDTQGQY